MKHTLITSIIGLAMVASMSTTAVAEDNFSILEGIQAEAMTETEMDAVEGKGVFGQQVFFPWLNNSMIRTTQGTPNFVPLYPQAQAQVVNSGFRYINGIAAGHKTVVGAALDMISQSPSAAIAVAPYRNAYPSVGSQTNGMPQGPTYNPYAQMRYQQQMQQYQYQQRQAQAQMNYRYNQGMQRTYGGLRLAGVNIGCGLAYCR